MEHPILTSIRRAGFVPFGWFEPTASDRVPGDAKFVILVGNAGPDMFRRFAHERDVASDKIDDWTRGAIEGLASDLAAQVVFPFDKPPLPFLTWARRAGAGHVSPLGLNIHATYGLWHAFRAALLFPVAFDLPMQSAGAHPCETCADKPCLTACPVNAFDGITYSVAACASHVGSPEGQDCMGGGCLARLACPVGKAFTYHPSQAQFFMRAFVEARRKMAGAAV
jgi:hypothetical protein